GRARFDELRLEFRDLVIGPLPFGLRREALDPLDEHAAVPGAIVDRDLPMPGNVAPESPEVRMCALFVGRRRRADHTPQARVDRLGDPTDRPALARRVVAFEDEDRGLAAF